MERTIVQLVKLDPTGDSCYRMQWPGRSIAELNPGIRFINLEANAEERFEWALHADLLVLFQSMDPDMLTVLDERQRLGKKTLVEYNDNFYKPQAWSPVAKEWGSYRVWGTYEKFIERADGVLVTGPGLKDLFSPITKAPIYILENHLPEAPKEFAYYWGKKTNYPSFGWAGSLGHMADLLAIVPLIEEILAEVPGSKFHVMGNASIPEHIRIPPDRLVFTPWGGMEEYFRFWESVRVGLAPLLDSPYNMCRSDIKAVEMSSRAVVPVLTELQPYNEFIRRNGLLSIKTFDEVQHAIVGYLKNIADQEKVARACHHSVSSDRIQSQRLERYDLYCAHFPKERGNFQWPMKCGYHEIVGTPCNSTKGQEILKIAQDSLKQKRGQDALQVVQDFINLNPHDAEVRYAHLQILRAAKDGTFSKRALDAAQEFPRDIRFWIFTVQSLDFQNTFSRWRELYSRLRRAEPEYVQSINEDLCRAMSNSLTEHPKLVETAEELLLFYPFAYRLRFQIAETLERAGRVWEARAHFETLCRAKREFESGASSIGELGIGYLQAWFDAIDARIKRKFV